MSDEKDYEREKYKRLREIIHFRLTIYTNTKNNNREEQTSYLYSALIGSKTKRNSLLWRENLRSFLKNGMLARFFRRLRRRDTDPMHPIDREPRATFTDRERDRENWMKTVLARSRADSKCPVFLGAQHTRVYVAQSHEVYSFSPATRTRYFAFPLNPFLPLPCGDHGRHGHYVRAPDRRWWHC